MIKLIRLAAKDGFNLLLGHPALLQKNLQMRLNQLQQFLANNPESQERHRRNFPAVREFVRTLPLVHHTGTDSAIKAWNGDGLLSHRAIRKRVRDAQDQIIANLAPDQIAGIMQAMQKSFDYNRQDYPKFTAELGKVMQDLQNGHIDKILAHPRSAELLRNYSSDFLPQQSGGGTDPIIDSPLGLDEYVFANIGRHQTDYGDTGVIIHPRALNAEGTITSDTDWSDWHEENIGTKRLHELPGVDQRRERLIKRNPRFRGYVNSLVHGDHLLDLAANMIASVTESPFEYIFGNHRNPYGQHTGSVSVPQNFPLHLPKMPNKKRDYPWEGFEIKIPNQVNQSDIVGFVVPGNSEKQKLIAGGVPADRIELYDRSHRRYKGQPDFDQSKTPFAAGQRLMIRHNRKEQA